MRLFVKDVLVRAWQRGYSPQEIAPCLGEHFGHGYYEVDVDHPAYPKVPRPSAHATRGLLSDYLPGAMAHYGHEYIANREDVAGLLKRGPGVELKKLLSRVGITATPNCSCNARAREMDIRGADWCEANIDTIVGWLREEAAKRGLPFLDAAGRLLVKRAIRNARKAVS
jgi:hypothetical protein